MANFKAGCLRFLDSELTKCGYHPYLIRDAFKFIFEGRKEDDDESDEDDDDDERNESGDDEEKKDEDDEGEE